VNGEPDTDVGDPRLDEHLVWLGEPLVALHPRSPVKGWATGYVILDDGNVVEGLDVARHFARDFARNPAAIDDTVARSNGCFAAALALGDEVVLAGDRGGTTPIYTGRAGGRLVASADPWRVVDALDTATLDDAAVLDMLRLGYVAGDRTLLRGVDVLPGGTVVHVRRHHARHVRYWRFEPFPKSEQATSDAALEVALRLNAAAVVRMLNGRVAGVPLSGGLDTRVITTLLHHLGANVRAFTYGPPGDPEVEIGTRVARTIGVEHDVVPIDQHYLNDAFVANATRAVGLTTRFTCGLGAHHVDAGSIDVFVPGHGGCYSDYQIGVFNAAVSTRRQALRYVYWKHYQLDADDVLPGRLFDVDYERARWQSLDETLADLDVKGDLVAGTYRWSVENRQRKLIAMEQRVYEQHAPWVFPLHDHRVTDFFLRTPRRLLVSQKAYKQAARRIFAEYEPELLTIPRIGGSLEPDRKTTFVTRALEATRPFSSVVLSPLQRRSHGYAPSAPAPVGAEGLRYWFHTDPVVRDFVLDHVASFDIPLLRVPAMRDALLTVQNDKIFVRTLAAAMTVHEVQRQLAARRGKGGGLRAVAS
jgi:asparagine synthase (glutamine-hydrolysing)